MGLQRFDEDRRQAPMQPSGVEDRGLQKTQMPVPCQLQQHSLESQRVDFLVQEFLFSPAVLIWRCFSVCFLLQLVKY